MNDAAMTSQPRPPTFASQLATSIGMLSVLTILTGIAYPLLVTGIAQVGFNDRANGSLIVRDGRVVGSELIGQPFDDPKYFWGRPSATSPAAYNATASTGSNLGPTNTALTAAVKDRIEALRAAGHDVASVPVDLVTASASGLDPHISPAAAAYQRGRVARARDVDEARLQSLIDASTEGRDLGVLGEPRVNVLLLNLALDKEVPRT